LLQSFVEKEWKHVHSLLDRSEFQSAMSFFSRARLPNVKKACIDDIYFMEAFNRLLIAQGYQKKSLPIIARAIERLYDLELHQEPIMAKYLIYQGQALSAIQEHSHVLPLYQQAYELLENKPENQSDFGYIYLGLAQSDALVQDWEMYLENSLDCFRNANNPIGEATALNAYGIYYGALGDSGLALDYFQKALTLSKEHNDLRRYAGCLNNQAVLVYFNEPNSDEALGLELLNDAIGISKKAMSLEFLVQHHKALVHFFHSKNDNISAIPHLRSIFELQEKRGLLTESHRKKYQELIMQKKPLIDSLSTIS
jgi:tetratricopeptide (TPR) repeat protein